MKSNYKKIGDYVCQVSNRNTDLKITNLKGININKDFMPSVANINGTDLTKYKIVEKGQFAFNPMHVGRDEMLPISLLREDDPVIVSPAYTVFEIKDSNILNPEYLMMWCKRSEFDRNCWFTTDNSVRGGFSWEEFCDIKLPIPDIEKQNNIVKAYKSFINQIENKQKTIGLLEDLIKNVYKEWFINYNFPLTSNFSKVIENQELIGKKYKESNLPFKKVEDYAEKIPMVSELFNLNDFVLDSLGGDWGKESPEGNYSEEVICIRGTDIPDIRQGITSNAPTRYILSKNLKNRNLEAGDIVIEISGGSPIQSTGRPVLITSALVEKIGKGLICSNFNRTIKLKKLEYSTFIYSHFLYLYDLGKMFIYENSTTGVKNFDLEDFLTQEKIVVPESSVILNYSRIFEKIYNLILNNGQQIDLLNKNLNTLISRLMVV